MNKLELVRVLAQEARISNAEADKTVKTVFDAMADSLMEGERVEVREFCTFQVREYQGYTGRNPKTGKATKVKPKKLPYFKSGKELKERVTNGK